MGWSLIDPYKYENNRILILRGGIGAQICLKCMLVCFFVQEYRAVFCPHCIPADDPSNNHWILIVAYPKLKVMHCFDSCNRGRNQQLGEFQKVFDAAGCNYKWDKATLKSARQQDGHSCGVYVCMHVVSLCFGIPEEEWPSIEYCRRLITKTIATGSFRILRSTKVNSNYYHYHFHFHFHYHFHYLNCE
jgi:hypothetical protein